MTRPRPADQGQPSGAALRAGAHGGRATVACTGSAAGCIGAKAEVVGPMTWPAEGMRRRRPHQETTPHELGGG
jgi:hypothetical protein